MTHKKTVRVISAASAISLACTSLVTVTTTAHATVTGVSSGANAGVGTLRAAINEVNAGLANQIDFAGGITVTLTSPLPTITKPVFINGVGSVNVSGVFVPDTQVNFNKQTGLKFASTARGSTVSGVALYSARGAGVTVDARRFTLNNTVIGLKPNGSAAPNTGPGLLLNAGASRARIGRNPTNSSHLIGNVISGNGGAGIELNGADSATIVSNLVGTDFTGDSAVANNGGGILLTNGANRNMIGGTVYVNSDGDENNPTGTEGTVTPTFIIPPLGNHVSGNKGNGITITGGSTANTLSGNFVGTTRNGNARNPNTGDGVRILNADGNTLSGCKFVNNPFVYYNVVSGNNGDGVEIRNSDNTTVQANFFGVGANNTNRVANLGSGINVTGDSRKTQVGGVIPLGNVSAGNAQHGIAVRDRASNFITFNTFGGLLAFKGAMPNGKSGLFINSSGGNITARTNVFSGNNGHGIEITGNATGVDIQPNIVGMTTNGRTKLPNAGNGVYIHGRAHGIQIGGRNKSVIFQNTFSGNKGYGILIGENAYNVLVIDTYVGVEIFGQEGASNNKGGLLLTGRTHNNTIGLPSVGRGDVAHKANIFSANGGDGIKLNSGTYSNLIRNNYVGVSRLGESLPNADAQLVNLGRGNVLTGNKTKPWRY